MATDSATLEARAAACHKRFPLFDGHNDLPWAMKKGFENRLEAVDLRLEQRDVQVANLRHGALHTDIPRLRRGGAGAQFWSVYVPTSITGPLAVQQTLEQVDLVHRMCAKYPEAFEFAWTSADVLRIFESGKIASMCGAEGGHQINSSLGSLRMLHRLGVRYMTLTHNGGPGWATPALTQNGTFIPDDPDNRGLGLSAFGCEVVREMNWVGMLVDISHVHADTMRRALEITESPVIFSHSGARAVCSHKRNVPDDVLIMLKKNRGVCLVNFNEAFVKDMTDEAINAPDNPAQLPGATISDVADHVDHIRAVAGIECVGIGADYDGIKHPAVGMPDVEYLPKLTEELLKRGYSDEDVGKVLGLNAVRVLAECEQVAARLQSERLASEKTREELDGLEGEELFNGDAPVRKKHRIAPPASSVDGPVGAMINAEV